MRSFAIPLALGLVLSSSLAHADRRAMPPMPVPNAEASKTTEAPATLWLPANSAGFTLRATVRDALKSAPVDLTVEHTNRLQVGAARDLPAAQQRIALASLPWQTLADGSQVARVRVEIEAASSVRLGYRVEGGLAATALRFGSTDGKQVEAGRAPAQDDAVSWTQLFDGDAALVDIRVATGTAITGQTLAIEHAVGFDVKSDLTQDVSKRAADIGASQSCQIDLACVSNPSAALLQAAKSVAKIIFQSRDGRNYLCTATLIANVGQKPLLYTANHCLGDQGEANSMVSYWAFEAASCGARNVPTFQTVQGGSRLLFTDARIDVSISEMYFSPPSFAVLSGWDVDMVRRNTVATLLHHPTGDLKKYTSGSIVGYTNVRNVIPDSVPWVSFPGDQTSSYITTLWNQGSSEGGSSGAPLFTFDTGSSICPGGCYLFRGGLAQGSASCSAPNSPDRFSRFDLAYPYVASIINPADAPPAMNGTIATEYYNATNDHYFITADGGEANYLDDPSIRVTGWYRTGYTFGIYPRGTVGAAPVCRFFGDVQGFGPNSHFYTADAGECSFVASPGSGWKREDADAFRVTVPARIGIDGCPAGTKALYRTYNNRNQAIYTNNLSGRITTDSNHRYFTDSRLFDVMLEKDTWGLEPIGRAPIMCVR